MHWSTSRAASGWLCALAIISIQLAATPVFAATSYTATLLYTLQQPPDGVQNTWGYGDYQSAYSGIVGGWRHGPPLSDFDDRATMWSGPNGASIYIQDNSFNALYANTRINAISATQQIGFGFRTSFQGGNLNDHALLWSGTPSSRVDLNPGTFDSSYGTAVGVSQQVGYGSPTGAGGKTHALLWSGTAASVIDLQPTDAKYTASQAMGIGGGHEVGNGTTSGGSHALMWTGTVDSVIDLHSSAFSSTGALAVDQDQEVGIGIPVGGSQNHALLWSGTAESVLDLNPTGYVSSQAMAVLNGIQVGYGKNTTISSSPIALAWSGSADSYINLHSLLPLDSLGRVMPTSEALTIDPSGNIWGVARDASNNIYAVEWSPPSIPEPRTSIVLLLTTALALLRRPAGGASQRPT